jgi:hypothetical protein
MTDTVHDSIAETSNTAQNTSLRLTMTEENLSNSLQADFAFFAVNDTATEVGSDPEHQSEVPHEALLSIPQNIFNYAKPLTMNTIYVRTDMEKARKWTESSRYTDFATWKLLDPDAIYDELVTIHSRTPNSWPVLQDDGETYDTDAWTYELGKHWIGRVDGQAAGSGGGTSTITAEPEERKLADLTLHVDWNVRTDTKFAEKFKSVASRGGTPVGRDEVGPIVILVRSEHGVSCVHDDVYTDEEYSASEEASDDKFDPI